MKTKCLVYVTAFFRNFNGGSLIHGSLSKTNEYLLILSEKTCLRIAIRLYSPKCMEQSSGTIPPLCEGGTTYEENIDKGNLLNDYFSSQTVLDESQNTLPNSSLEIGAHSNQYTQIHTK